jgi:hypothetical protein
MSGHLLHLRASKKAFFHDCQGGGRARLDCSFFPLSFETQPTSPFGGRLQSRDIIGFMAALL